MAFRVFFKRLGEMEMLGRSGVPSRVQWRLARTTSVSARTPSVSARTPSVSARTPSVSARTPSVSARTPSVSAPTLPKF